MKAKTVDWRMFTEEERDFILKRMDELDNIEDRVEDAGVCPQTPHAYPGQEIRT